MSRDAGALVTELYERYQARDWEAAARVLHPEAQVALPATGEHLSGRDGVIAFQRDYPEPWGDLSVMRVVASTSHGQDGEGEGEGAAAELRITAEAGEFRCAAFWVVRDGLLADGVEYWVTVGGEEPPPYRRGDPA